MQVIKTVTIQNLGDADLNLTGTPMVELTGDTSFSLDLTSLVSPITGGGSSTFDIIFEPTTLGVQSAQISIINNDNDENPYIVNFTGVGIEEQEMDITIDGSSVASGGTYDFGDIVIS